MLSFGSHSVHVLAQSSVESAAWGTVRPYVWHGEVLVSDKGHHYAYTDGGGSLAWSHEFPGQVVRDIGITPDLLYFEPLQASHEGLGTMQGMVYAFSPEHR